MLRILKQSFLVAAALVLWAGAANAQYLPGLDTGSRAAALDAEIASVLQEIEQKEADKARIDAEIGGLGQRRSAARERLHERTEALYRIRRAGMLPLAGGFDALLSHQARVERLTRMVEADLSSLGGLSTRGEALRAETGELAREIEEARRSLTALQGRKQAFDEEQRMTSLFDSAFTGGSSPIGNGMAYGQLQFSDGAAGPGFASQRGRLAMPVAGAADLRPGVRDGASGLEFLAPAGTMVLAAADGRVAFAGRHGSYGILVILDHGGAYYTAYGGMGGLDVRIGDPIRRGTRIGEIAGDHRPALFFEVRHGTSPLPAEDWLGL